MATEVAGLTVALVLALIAIWHLTSTARAWMLFYDADSVLPALISGSLRVGQPQDWSLSAVLFLPETALYLVLAALSAGTKAALALNAVVNFALLYSVLRVAARVAVPRATRVRQVTGAVLALAAIVALTLLDSSDRWDGAELPSLLATTTYYSATVLALILTPPVAALTATRSSRWRKPAGALAALSALSTLTNPLYLGWVVVPLVLVVLLVWGRKLISGRAAALTIGGACGGGVVGQLLRIPLAPYIARDSTSYADPGEALHVLFGYYLRVTIDRAATVAGAFSLLGAVVLLLIAGIVYARAIRRGDARIALISGFGWLAPPIVLIGAIALGTHAYRYLQPFYFAPLLALVVLPEWAGRPRLPDISPRAARSTALAGIAGLVALALAATAQIAAVVSTNDASIGCVTSWITASHRVGAGRFVTIRGPKAYLPDPRQLIQVTPAFGGYLSLVNRDDYRQKNVSFIVSDAAAAAPRPTSGLPLSSPTLVHCGRYTITDYHRDVLPVGPLTTEYDP